MGVILDELKPCPFCGKKDTLILTDARDMEGCARFDSEECPCYLEDTKFCGAYAVVCNFCAGGCGASSGYSTSRDKAIEKWNTRTEK